jgi:hypothetical protein
VWRAISDRNPFYLLSAVCMLFGCVALTNSSSWVSIRLQRLLILTATLNFYELLLIGLALFLIARRGLRRDGAILLILEAFFLVDVTFLNSEIFSADLKIGLAANGILLAIALFKVAAIFRGLGISLASGAFAVTMIELAMLFTLPGVYKLISLDHNGGLPAMVIYASWWAVGLLPVLATLLLGDRPWFNEVQRENYRRNRRLILMLMVLPVVSLLAHICTSNWIYKVRWYPANVSPLLLGLGVAIGASDFHVRTLARRMRWHFVLPIMAIVLAVNYPSALVLKAGSFGVSPLRITLFAAMLVYGHGFVLYHHALFAWAACLCFGWAGIGMSIDEMMSNVSLASKKTYSVSQKLWPRTMSDWGIISVAMSFVLLAIGAIVSLRKKPPDMHVKDDGEVQVR